MIDFFQNLLLNPKDMIQLAFYIVSPIGTFLAVGTAYYAIYRQTKPSIIVYYEPSPDVGSVIDLVISNIGSGTARDITFSSPLPIGRWGIETSGDSGNKGGLNQKIPILAPGKEFRFSGGQYGGLLSEIGDGKEVTVSFIYRTPLRSNKKGSAVAVLNIKYMEHMSARNSAAYDLSDAMKGRNNTVFVKMNKSLVSIDKSLSILAKNSEARTSDP
jgi:hypothetical protein